MVFAYLSHCITQQANVHIIKKFFIKKTCYSINYLALVAFLSACQQTENIQTPQPVASQPTASQVKSEALTNQITLYTSIDKQALQPLVDNFTKTTDIKVNIVNDQPISILARLKAEGEHSPADLILTEDVGVFQQGVDETLLQPFSSSKALSNVPERFKDPNGNWLALSYYGRTIVYDSQKLTENDLSSYADLAKPKWYQKLCLTQGKYPPNQALTINLINNLGDKKTTEVLQGWVTNLAMPPVLDDAALMQAIDSGKCDLGLVNSHSYANYLQQHPQTPIQLKWANKGYGGTHTNITGIAISHNAKHPELALTFIEWLADKEQQSQYASLSKTFPVNQNIDAIVLLKSWGELEVSPMPIKKYAEQQKAATELMEKAGYY